MHPSLLTFSIIDCFLQLPPSSIGDQVAKLYVCSKFLESFTCVKEHEKNFADLSIDLLVGMREMLEADQMVLFYSFTFTLTVS